MTPTVPGTLPDGYWITTASLRHIIGVHRLEHRVFTQDAYSWGDLLLLFLLRGNVNLRALAPGGALAGFIAGGTVPGGSSRYWIITVAVSPAHQRLGLGSALMHACEQQLKAKTDEIYLTLRVSNTGARRLYERLGYQHVRVKPRYYGGEAGYEMRKRLK